MKKNINLSYSLKDFYDSKKFKTHCFPSLVCIYQRPNWSHSWTLSPGTVAPSRSSCSERNSAKQLKPLRYKMDNWTSHNAFQEKFGRSADIFPFFFLSSSHRVRRESSSVMQIQRSHARSAFRSLSNEFHGGESCDDVIRLDQAQNSMTHLSHRG